MAPQNGHFFVTLHPVQRAAAIFGKRVRWEIEGALQIWYCQL
ncbi:MAG TPA: hypothetical protein VE844_02235 [Gammaproteobacteria bacterium]|nr:hypothetical protein [Gammaproteobacteria bacterium]